MQSRISHMVAAAGRAAATATLGLTIGAGLFAASGATAATSGAMQSQEAQDRELDTIILRTAGGVREIKGRIIEETSSHVRMVVVLGSMETETTYPRSDVLEITRGAPKAAADENAKPDRRDARRSTAPSNDDAVASTGPKVAFLNLRGRFGRDITPTPLREAMNEIRRHQPDFIVVEIDSAWGEDFEQAGFNGAVFQIEDLDPILLREVETEWEKVPQRVAYVKNAMGGAAFVPFLFKDIYFAPDGRMGGIGTLQEQFGETGDRMVRQKLMSAAMGHAEGVAIAGGYDPILIRAMAQTDFVLSVAFVGGQPIFYERMPQNIGEELLTDDGAGPHADTPSDIIRGNGNDTLTVRASLAKKLGLSKGTVGSRSDLLFELGIDRGYTEVETRAGDILEDWSEGVTEAMRDIPRLLQEAQEVQPTDNTMEAAIRANSLRINKLKSAIRLLERYEEAIPGAANTIAQLRANIEALELQNMINRQQNRNNNRRPGGGGGPTMPG